MATGSKSVSRTKADIHRGRSTTRLNMPSRVGTCCRSGRTWSMHGLPVERTRLFYLRQQQSSGPVVDNEVRWQPRSVAWRSHRAGALSPTSVHSATSLMWSHAVSSGPTFGEFERPQQDRCGLFFCLHLVSYRLTSPRNVLGGREVAQGRFDSQVLRHHAE